MGKYKVVKKLGQGSYGTVYLVQDDRDGNCYVMKKITVSGMSDDELNDCKKEIQILSVMNHPNIVQYKRSFVRKGALCIVMEYADGGDLHHRIRQQRHAGQYFPEDQILDWFTQACMGLKHVHDQKILHRDLKTQNIFLTAPGEVRLGDFGISRVLKNTMDQAHTLVGTPYYLSPEMVNGQPYDNRSDIWSMGVVLYELLTLQHPFNADSLQMLALKIIQGNYPPIPRQYSQDVNDLLSKMLEQDAKKRLSIEEVLRYPLILERVRKFYPDHEFIKEADGQIPKGKGRRAPKHNKNKLPNVPHESKEGKWVRRGSMQIRDDLGDLEPDWKVGADVGKERQKNSAIPSQQGGQSVARNTQVDILRAYLEERLGPARLQRIVNCLESNSSDEQKQKEIEKLIHGQKALLPIVHTLMYLSTA